VSELARRIAFAVIAAPLAVAAVYVGDAALATVLASIAAVGAWEFYRIARAGGGAPLASIGIALSALVPIAVHAWFLGYPMPLALAGLVVPALLALAIWMRGVDGRPLGAVATTLMGVLYTGLTLSFGYALRYHPYAVGPAAGTALVFLPVILTWASDIGGYAAGRTLGRRKLIPAVSPGKTVEGSIGALVATVAVCLGYVALVLRPYAQLSLRPLAVVGFAVAISVTAQVGDLAESLLKREADVKDSSHIIPGHGGVLDRFDSLFFVLPVAYLLLGYLVIALPVGS
jgi:phosphatidate cytidylyltransferase